MSWTVKQNDCDFMTRFEKVEDVVIVSRNFRNFDEHVFARMFVLIVVFEVVFDVFTLFVSGVTCTAD